MSERAAVYALILAHLSAVLPHHDSTARVVLDCGRQSLQAVGKRVIAAWLHLALPARGQDAAHESPSASQILRRCDIGARCVSASSITEALKTLPPSLTPRAELIKAMKVSPSWYRSTG